MKAISRCFFNKLSYFRKISQKRTVHSSHDRILIGTDYPSAVPPASDTYLRPKFTFATLQYINKPYTSAYSVSVTNSSI